MSQDGDTSEESELSFIDNDDNTISRAPIHIAQTGRRWVSRERLVVLKAAFPNLRLDKWTRSEIKILKNNWKRFKELWPDYSDPKFAFGSGHDNEGEWAREDIDQMHKKYREFQVLLRMAHGLEDRLLCDIYMKCRKRFYNKSFHFTKRKLIPTALEKNIIRDLKSKESAKIISLKYNVSPSVVDTIRRRPHRRARYKWCEESIKDLKLSVELVHGADILQAREIRWKRVAKEMRRSGHQLDKTQCYNKWIRLNPSSVIKKVQIDVIS